MAQSLLHYHQLAGTKFVSVIVSFVSPSLCLYTILLYCPGLVCIRQSLYDLYDNWTWFVV